MRRRMLAALCVVLAAACADPAPAPAPPFSSPSTSTSRTTAPTATAVPATSAPDPAASTTTSTTGPAPPTWGPGPRYLVYGEAGLARVVDGGTTTLLAAPVVHAWDDLMGGVVVADGTTAEIGHLRPGDPEPAPVVWDTGYGYARFTGLVDERPVLFYAGVPDGEQPEDNPCGDWSLNSRDLVSGQERRHLCLPVEDASFGIASVGSGLFVGAPFAMCGGTGTASYLAFWDLDGIEVEVAVNPFPASAGCAPCELSARISPDGRLLAYRFRPDAFHADSPYYEGPACGGGAEQMDAWMQGSGAIDAEVAVVDLVTGAVTWRMEVAADIGLADFDGRYLVTGAGERSVVWDTTGAGSRVEVAGSVALLTAPGG